MRFVLLSLIVLISCSKKQEDHGVLLYDTSVFKLVNGDLFYKNELFTGTLIKTHDISNSKTTSTYVKGKKHGEELKYFNTEVLIEQRFYTKGYKSGIHRGWWKNGNKRFEYHFNDKGEYNGEVKEWYQNKQKMKAFHFKNGKEEGTQQLWRSDGKIRANFVTKEGERYGLIGLKKCYTVNTINEDYK